MADRHHAVDEALGLVRDVAPDVGAEGVGLTLIFPPTVPMSFCQVFASWLEIVSINAYETQLLACAADPDPAPRFVRDLLDPGLQPPQSIHYPLRSVTVWGRIQTDGPNNVGWC